MLTGFLCPDGEKTTLQDCFKACRLGDRCQEEPDLHMMSEEREWKGTASTTQLLNGTMLSFLKLTQPYWIDPDSRAFMLQGTRHHKELEIVARELGLATEIALNVDRDIFDLLVWQDKTLCLVDRKVWGSYHLATALGIVEVGKMPDPSGECYKSSGRWGKEGTPKMIPRFEQVPDKADNHETELQLNRYRILLKEKVGLNVGAMYLRVLVRDGGLYIAHNRGVYRNTYKVPIKFLPDTQVLDYFHFKADALKQALEEEHWEFPCSPEESWDGVRCKSYCEVWEYCPKGILIHGIGGKGE